MDVAVREHDFRTAELLRCGEGIVHSVFDHAVNIRCGDCLYTVLSGPHLPSPYTAWVDETCFPLRDVRPGCSVRREGERLFLGPETVLNFRDAALRDPFFAAVVWDSSAVGAGLERIGPEIHIRRDRSPAAAFYDARYLGGERPRDLIQRELSARMEALMDAFSSRDQVLPRAEALIGAGIGLTPSGDDFLCGLLLVLQRAQHPVAEQYAQWLIKGVRRGLEKRVTTDVSRQMLLLHTAGQAPRLYEQFIEDLLGGGEGLSADLRQLDEVGYSSGIDFAGGVTSGCRLLLKTK